MVADFLTPHWLHDCLLVVFWGHYSLTQFSSVAQSCLTVCNPMDCSTPGLPVCHQLPEFTQTHVHQVGGVIQPSHPLSSPSPAPNPSQHQGLFQWVTLCMRWPKYWSFSPSISPSNEHPGLVSFKRLYPLPWLLYLKHSHLKKPPPVLSSP